MAWSTGLLKRSTDCQGFAQFFAQVIAGFAQGFQDTVAILCLCVGVGEHVAGLAVDGLQSN